MAEYRLIEEIVARSEANNWDKAKLEWDLYKVYEAEDPETCLCGHFPIIEVCLLRNRINNQIVTVGNCCVKKFLCLPSDRIFKAVKRIRKDWTKSLNAETVEYAVKNGWINEWERSFYFDIMRKRNLSNKQLVIKIEINKKVALCMQHHTSSEG